MIRAEHTAERQRLPTGKLENEKVTNALVDQASAVLKGALSDILIEASHEEWLTGSESDLPITLASDPEYTAECIEAYTNDYLESDFFKQLPYEDQMRAIKVLESDDIRWRGNYAVDETGLWPETSHHTEVRGGVLSQFVLSGLLGSELLSKSHRLDRFARAIEGHALKRAIMVGSASLASNVNHPYYLEDGSGYSVKNTSGEQITTHIGADFHGDFRSVRYSHLIGEVRDNITGFDHAFAPTFDHKIVAAYHSVEPRITEALLRYLVVNKSKDPKQLRERLLTHIVEKDSQTKRVYGAFGDFDSEDGLYSALSIHKLVSEGGEKEAPQESLASLLVHPGDHSQMLEITASKGGVQFAPTGKEGQGYGYFIPDDEVEEYIVNLACATGGRVTLRAHLPIISALNGQPLE